MANWEFLETATANILIWKDQRTGRRYENLSVGATRVRYRDVSTGRQFAMPRSRWDAWRQRGRVLEVFVEGLPECH